MSLSTSGAAVKAPVTHRSPEKQKPSIPSQGSSARYAFTRRVAALPGVSAEAKLLAIVLADMAGAKGESWPKQATLAKACGFLTKDGKPYREAAARAVREARQAGIMQSIRGHRGNRYRFSWYSDDGPKGADSNPEKGDSRCAEYRTSDGEGGDSRCAEYRTSDVQNTAHHGGSHPYKANHAREASSGGDTLPSQKQPAAAASQKGKAEKGKAEKGGQQFPATRHDPELEARLSRICKATIRETQVADVFNAVNGDREALIEWAKRKRAKHFDSVGGILYVIRRGEVADARERLDAVDQPFRGTYQEPTGPAMTEAEKEAAREAARPDIEALEATLRARQMTRQSGAMGDGLTPRSPEDVLAVMAVNQTRRPDGTMDTEAAEAKLAKLAECESCKGHGVTDSGPCNRNCMAARWLVTARGKRLLAGYPDDSPTIIPAPVLAPVAAAVDDWD